MVRRLILPNAEILELNNKNNHMPTISSTTPQTSQTTQIGGNVIGIGGEGCVISPHIECSHIDKNKISKLLKKSKTSTKSKKNKTSNIYDNLKVLDISKLLNKTAKSKHSKKSKTLKLVSKLTIKSLEKKRDLNSFKTLQNIEEQIKQIPNYADYFCVSYGYCKLKQSDVSNRSDILLVNYINPDDDDDYRIQKSDKDKKVDSTFCKINMKFKPYNIIYPYCGIDLFTITNFDMQRAEKKAKIHKELETVNEHIFNLQRLIKKDRNLKIILYNLLQGLKILHENGIIHRDIKIENILLLEDEKTYNLKPLIADFGLSISTKLATRAEMINFIDSTNGSYGLYAPDILAVNICINYPYIGNKNLYKYLEYEITNNNYIKYHDILNFEYVMDINFKDIHHNKLHTIINTINEQLENNTYFDEYYKPIDGYGYLYDIYSMGMTFYEIYYNLFISEYVESHKFENIYIDDKLKDLILNMTEYDPLKRFNINKCLEHPYFANII